MTFLILFTVTGKLQQVSSEELALLKRWDMPVEVLARFPANRL